MNGGAASSATERVYVVVTTTRGPEIVEACALVENGPSFVFQRQGEVWREYSRREILLWEECAAMPDAVQMVAELRGVSLSSEACEV